jgi:hypothetical protein
VDDNAPVDLNTLQKGKGIKFLKEFTAANKIFKIGSLGIFLLKQTDGQYRVKMQDDSAEFRVIDPRNMVVSHAPYYDCTVMVSDGKNVVDCNRNK